METPPDTGDPPEVAWQPGVLVGAGKLTLCWGMHRDFWTRIAPEAWNDLQAAKTGPVVT